MCLRATSLGLGSLWIRDTNRINEQIEELYPKNGFDLNSSLLIGYSDSKPKMRPRKKLEEITECIFKIIKIDKKVNCGKI